MSRFHRLRVKDIRRETDECVSVSFDIPDELKDTYRFKQGQYLTLRETLDGEEVRRSYSLCSSPLENEWRVAIKLVEDGRFSTFANTRLRVGDQIEVMPPEGRFYTDVDPDQRKNYLAFAAGSGITPVISIIKTVLRTEPKSTFTLFYGNRDTHSIIFREEIESLKNRYVDRFRNFHVLSRERLDADLFYGRIDRDKFDAYCQSLFNLDTVDEIFLCGPEEMIFSLKEHFEKQHVDAKKIHFELFTTPVGGPVTSTVVEAAPIEDGQCHISIKLDGKSFDFAIPAGSNNILDAAIENGHDVPYSCKGGVCSTCRAKLLDGKVEMELNYALEPDEVEAGYVLTCQSMPQTSKIVVDYDQ